MSNIVERFEAAVEVLIADGPVKQRLAKAYSDHLEDLRELELPIESSDAFSDLHAALHRVSPVGQEGPVKASVQKMSVLEAGWHAKTIFMLYGELLAAGRRVEPLTVVETVPIEPPRFLVGRN
jgi:hypothetical protein